MRWGGQADQPPCSRAGCVRGSCARILRRGFRARISRADSMDCEPPSCGELPKPHLVRESAPAIAKPELERLPPWAFGPAPCSRTSARGARRLRATSRRPDERIRVKLAVVQAVRRGRRLVRHLASHPPGLRHDPQARPRSPPRREQSTHRSDGGPPDGRVQHSRLRP